jgi:hypothetical protein
MWTYEYNVQNVPLSGPAEESLREYEGPKVSVVRQHLSMMEMGYGSGGVE